MSSHAAFYALKFAPPFVIVHDSIQIVADQFGVREDQFLPTSGTAPRRFVDLSHRSTAFISFPADGPALCRSSSNTPFYTLIYSLLFSVWPRLLLLWSLFDCVQHGHDTKWQFVMEFDILAYK